MNGMIRFAVLALIPAFAAIDGRCDPPPEALDAAADVPKWAKCRPAIPNNPHANLPPLGPVDRLDPNDKGLEYLNYQMPENAVQGRNWRGFIDYRDPTAGQVVCKEHHSVGSLVSRKLYKDGKLHGVQKTWHHNGQLESAHPYKNGVMHGLFRHWDYEGQLVGCYRITNGEGTARIYHSNGQLAEETPYRDSRRNGLRVAFYGRGYMTNLGYWRNHRLNGHNWQFFDDGKVYRWGNCDSEGAMDGVYVLLEVAPSEPPPEWLKPPRYYLHGRQVSAEEYEAAAKQDAKLPRFEKDPKDYRKVSLPKEVEELIQRYAELPPVKMPLECKEVDGEK